MIKLEHVVLASPEQIESLPFHELITDVRSSEEGSK